MGNLSRAYNTAQAIGCVLSVIDADDLLDRLDDYRWTGRKGYSSDAMWNAILVKYLLHLRYVRDLIALLHANRPLRRVCGFRDTVPSESTFSRFYARLAQHQDLVDQTIATASHVISVALANDITEGKLPPKSPDPGRVIAIDSSDIPAFAAISRHRSSVDPDAAWGHRTPKNTISDPDKGELFFGYKIHALCDAYYGFPITWTILPANAHDSPQLPDLMDSMVAEYPYLPTRYVLADRGYDSLSNYRDIDSRRNVYDRRLLSVILMRNTDRNGIYSVHGRPYCLGKQEMEYVRTDKGKGHLFRCPDGGCALKTEKPWLGPCRQEHHENWQDDRLRKVGRLPRASRRWANLYKRRTVIERMFSSLKRSRLMDDCRYLGMAKTCLHVALSILTYSATMMVRVLEGDYRGMRNMALDWMTPTWTAHAA